MPVHPPQAEAIDYKVDAQPGHQPERQCLPLAEEAEQRDRDLGQSHRQHQLPKLNPDDGINQGQKTRVAQATPNLRNTSQTKNSSSSVQKDNRGSFAHFPYLDLGDAAKLMIDSLAIVLAPTAQIRECAYLNTGGVVFERRRV